MIEYAGQTVSKSYTWGMDLSGSMQGAGGVGGLLGVTEHGTSSDTDYYPTYDGNGNVSEYLDASGTVQAHYEYDAFGNTLVSSGAKANDFVHRFSTKPHDAETGLYYYGYRYYDPVTGRWPSRDPIEENGGENLYGFVKNDALNRADAFGLKIVATEWVVTPKKYWDREYTGERWTKAGKGAAFTRKASISQKRTDKSSIEVSITGDYVASFEVKTSTEWERISESSIEVEYKYEFRGRQIQNSIQEKEWKVVTRKGGFCSKPRCKSNEIEVAGSRVVTSGYVDHNGILIGYMTVKCQQSDSIRNHGSKYTRWYDDKKSNGKIFRDGVEIAGGVSLRDFFRHSQDDFQRTVDAIAGR